MDDASLRAALRAASWHRSPGYGTARGRVGPHEYVLAREAPALHAAMQTRLQTDAAAFDGAYLGYRYRYLALDGYKYWILDDVLNREALPAPVPC